MTRGQFDHLGLLCDVGDLAARLAGSADIDAFLNQIVYMIGEHLRSDVCSIYLFDETNRQLLLRATRGLAPESVGRVRMAFGEGLTGLALKELRPIRESAASQNPHFKAFAGINEELYESFLAVPIRRGVERVGVLVIQRREQYVFSDEDVAALQAIASQLATAIENALVLTMLGAEGSSAAPKPQTEQAGALPSMVRGVSAVEGFAFGPAAIHDPARAHRLLAEHDFAERYTREDFHAALESTATQIQQQQEHIGRQLPEVASLIFDAHLMMLKDNAFVGQIETRIAEGRNPPDAILDVGRKYADLFAANPHAYIREKVQDLEDLVGRLVDTLVGATDSAATEGAGRVVIARHLYPSDLLKLGADKILGLVLVSGGVTSHVAILSRSLGIPLVIAEDPRLLQMPPRTRVLLDATTGNLYLSPSPEVIARFREQDATRAATAADRERMRPITETADGARVRLLANVNLLSDIPLARELFAEGVGLYRSEFPFLVRPSFPSEEEQCVIYRRLLQEMGDREVTIRTLDTGGDKLLSCYDAPAEENPVLGLRSIRFSLRHPEVFEQQLRAILRAGAEATGMRIMFPMISSLEEYRQARLLLKDCACALGVRGEAVYERMDVGVMIEVPAAVEIVDTLALHADFLCIGSNDLTQFLLAVDRNNEQVASLYRPGHPAVLKALARIAEGGRRHGKEVSLCGEMAHEPRFLPFLVGIGIRAYSVDPRFLPRLQQTISRLRIPDCQRHAGRLLAQETIRDVEAKLDEFFARPGD